MIKSYDNILTALKYYIPRRYWNLNNWNVIINREVEVAEDIYAYKCSFFTLYFDSDLNPVNYGKQHIIGDEVYYDRNSNNIGAGTYTLLGFVDWYNQYDWGV